MTEKEKDVLSLLKQNARLSVKDISALIDSSEKEVETLIKKLESEGVILNYTCVSNDQEENQVIRAIIEVSIRPEKKSGYDFIADKISANKYVIDHYLMSGDYDFLIIVEAENLSKVSAIISDLASMPNVTNTVSRFTLKRYKQMGVILTKSKNQSRLAIVP
jgi:DNA-binding Lrp family transcriptional regulator